MLLKFGSKNTLEVHVWKHSANKSVNNAERRADWWLFGGIYRPVWLEVSPKTHIENIADDPKMDGSISVDVNLKNIAKNVVLEWEQETIIFFFSGGEGENSKVGMCF
mgnify:CR=1 FL=1